MALVPDDILAIQKLVADYNHVVDTGNGEAFAALFVDGGSLDTGFNVVKGADELRGFADFVPTMAPGARHLVSNVSIDGDGETATHAPLPADVVDGGRRGGDEARDLGGLRGHVAARRRHLAVRHAQVGRRQLTYVGVLPVPGLR